MQTVDNYLEHLNEDFGFQMKAFKAKKLKKMADGIKKNVRGKKVNVPAIKKILNPIPVLSQDKINKFLSKYVPNYTPNYNTTLKHFKKKYPSDKGLDSIAGVTAVMASIDKDKSLQDQIRRSDKLYSSNMGAGGGPFVLFIIGVGIAFSVFSMDFLSTGTVILAVILGILLILASIINLAQ